MKVVVIDPGHGGTDPGAVSGTWREADLNLKISLFVQKRLAPYDCVVHMIRTTNVGSNINDRVARAKAWKADAYLCVHNNAGGGDGFECFYWHTDAKAKAFAIELEKHARMTGQNSRGVKPSSPSKPNFGACRMNAQNGIPAVLVEGFFIDNEKDRSNYTTDAALDMLAGAYATAVINFLNLKKKSAPPEPVKPTPTKPAEIYVVKDELKGYNDSYSAKDRRNATVVVKAGEYFVFKEALGMLNVTKVSGKAGSWINPFDNVAPPNATPPKVTPSVRVISVGSTVKLKTGSRTYDGKKLLSFVYVGRYTVSEIKGDRAVVKLGRIVIAAMKLSDLILV